jgi:hypothetical protein
MQRNAEETKRKRSRSRLCNSSASLCVAASLRQPYPFTNSFLERNEYCTWTGLPCCIRCLLNLL